jgi:acetyltransferase-like isoleucine patch superfamily enzyme
MLESTKAFLRKVLPQRWREAVSIYRNRGALRIGEGSRVHRSAQLLGRRNICIGRNSCISERVWINVNHRVADDVAVLIGNNTFIGRDNFFSSGRLIEIGDYCLTTIGCQFLGSTHIAETPWRPIITTGTTATDVLKVDANCFFGAGATVMGNVHVGHGCIIGAKAFVVGDLPPFSLAVGNPARVVKRYSFKRQMWVPVAVLNDDDLSENPDNESYLLMLRRDYDAVDMPWIAAGADQGSF